MILDSSCLKGDPMRTLLGLQGQGNNNFDSLSKMVSLTIVNIVIRSNISHQIVVIQVVLQ